MNLFKGFRMRSEKSRQDLPMDVLDRFASSDSEFIGELTLEEILADPVTRSMMARDRVDPADIVGMFRIHEQQAA
jgi:hypothetical protein